MVISMRLPPLSAVRLYLMTIGLVLVFGGLNLETVPAQEQEAGSATVEALPESGVTIPDESSQETGDDDEKKDERPRELGVMILIVWLLAGAGIGILIFTSLFGHSVRSMIRRPYPPQQHPEHRPQPEADNETENGPEATDEDTQKD